MATETGANGKAYDDAMESYIRVCLLHTFFLWVSSFYSIEMRNNRNFACLIEIEKLKWLSRKVCTCRKMSCRRTQIRRQFSAMICNCFYCACAVQGASRKSPSALAWIAQQQKMETILSESKIWSIMHINTLSTTILSISSIITCLLELVGLVQVHRFAFQNIHFEGYSCANAWFLSSLHSCLLPVSLCLCFFVSLSTAVFLPLSLSLSRFLSLSRQLLGHLQAGNSTRQHTEIQTHVSTSLWKQIWNTISKNIKKC